MGDFSAAGFRIANVLLGAIEAEGERVDLEAGDVGVAPLEEGDPLRPEDLRISH